MAGPLNAQVILARCSKNSKMYGIRIEERGGDWFRTWAFPIDERKAKREKFDSNAVSGSMTMDAEYPGCPHCGNAGFAMCSCEKISCMGGGIDFDDFMSLTCPWCGEEGEYGTADSFEVSGSGY